MKIEKLNIMFDKKVIFNDFSIEFTNFCVNGILSPSGWGKTTLLQFIAKNFPNISYVFQDSRLLENETVYTNLEIPLKNLFEKQQYESRIDNILNAFHLTDEKFSKVKTLSGGQKQRVNLARGILFPSEILLLDEPFQNLDEKLKFSIMDFLKKEWILKKQTVIFVTHEKIEAEYLCDTIFSFEN